MDRKIELESLATTLGSGTLQLPNPQQIEWEVAFEVPGALRSEPHQPRKQEPQGGEKSVAPGQLRCLVCTSA